MQRLATIIENGKVVGLVHGPDTTNQSITVNGRVWRFDFHEYCGPLWLRKDGNPRKCQNPNKKVWTAFQRWFNRWRKNGRNNHHNQNQDRGSRG